MKVLVKRSAVNAIESISDYITTEINMPETAVKYTDRLIAFGFDLGKHYKGYTICKNKKLASRGLHCATFEKKWVFAFKIGEKSIIIYYILWAPSLK